MNVHPRKAILSSISLALLVSMLVFQGQGLARAGANTTHEPASLLPAATVLAESGDTIPTDWWGAVQRDLAQAEYQITWQDETGLADLPSAYQAPNRAHNLRTYFVGSGQAGHEPAGIRVIPRTAEIPDWEWGLAWTGYGYASSPTSDASLSSVGEAELVAEGNRIEYRRATASGAELVEWYVNDERGLEQGFTLSAPPQPTQQSELVLELALTGSLTPRLVEDGAAPRLGAAIECFTPGGVRVLRYSNLYAYDATGRSIAVHLDLIKQVDTTHATSGSDLQFAIRITVHAAHAAYPITIDPLVTWPDWVAEGNQGFSWFGYSVGTAGDVNGDGYADLVVGAPAYYGEQPSDGRAYVYHGSASGLRRADAWTVDGGQARAYLGKSLGTAGDINGDGYDDLVVGAPDYDGGQEDEGRVYVYYGSASGLGMGAVWVAESDQAGAKFGSSVGTAGDVNGDGYDDLVIGAPDYDRDQDDEGWAYVYHGSASGLATTPSWTTESDQIGAHLGTSVGTAGDINGDGYADLVVGAPYYDGEQESEGRVYLYTGSASGLSENAIWISESSKEWANFGYSVGTAGDVNGDGYDDLAVGEPNYGDEPFEEGRAYVYHGGSSGLTPMAAWTAEGDFSFAHFGGAVGTAGDVNGDGYADLVVGAADYDGGPVGGGRVSVYHGSMFGLSTTATWIRDSDQGYAKFGCSVGTVRDVNDDGYDDLVVGAIYYRGEYAHQGRVYVYHGSASGLGSNGVWDIPSAGYSVGTAGDVNGDGYADFVVGTTVPGGGDDPIGRAFVYYGDAAGPDTSAAWTATSDQAHDRFGSSAATAGDVNGDGYADLVVGAPGYSGGQDRQGRVYVYHGSATGLNSRPDWTVDGDQAGALLGYSVSTAGDVNGDGYADLIVGAPYADRGWAYVYYGSASGLSKTAAWTVKGSEQDGYFGRSLSTAGDVNGDGYADVVVGSPWYAGGQRLEGRVYVYFGSASGLSGTAAWTVQSDQSAAFLGWAVGTAGDVNGDGYADLAVSAPYYDLDQIDEGAVFVYHGSASGLSATPDWRTVGGDTGSAEIGLAAGTAGDFSGDGYADLVVGIPSYNGEHDFEGRALLYLGSASGLSTNPARISQVYRAWSRLGYSVGTAGDVNGDGCADLILGMPTAGRTYVYPGGATGLATSAAWTVQGDRSGAQLGASVGTAGDINGDGYADVVVGAPSYDSGSENAGRAYVYHGSALGLSTTVAWRAGGDRADAKFGFAVGTAGDVNGDGYADLVIGAPDFGVAGEKNDGRVYVYHGAAAGLSSIPTWVIRGRPEDDCLGYSVGTAGDVDGDGYADLAVGAPCYSAGQDYEGRAYVYYGSASGLHGNADWTVESDGWYALLGRSVGAAGDVNGDGYSDLVVGSPYYNYGGDHEGRVFVYHGSPSGLRPSADWTADGDKPDILFGDTAGTAGDVNGDGYADLAIGASHYDGMHENEGRAYVYHGSASGLSKMAAWTTGGGQDWELFAYSVGTAGDVNGDGYADLVVGIPHVNGTQANVRWAHVYHGSAFGLAKSSSWAIDHAQAGAESGWSVGTAGDVNGDGYADLIVGAPRYDGRGPNEGQASLYYGSGGPGLSLNPRQRRSDDTAPIASLGRSTTNTFRLAALGRTPFGRGQVKLEWEVKPLGTPFDGTSLGQSAEWSDTGVHGIDLNEIVQNLQAETPYHWRLRLRYHSATTPLQQTSRWLTVPRNGWAEQDLRTGESLKPSAYLPVVHSDSTFD